MGQLPIRHAENLHARLDAWATLWDVPLLAKSIGIRISTRYRRSLGAYHPSRAQITLASWLLEEGKEPEEVGEARGHPLLDEVLCHEAAHAAVHLAFGGSGLRARVRPRPHGAEWRGFMRAAGFEARVRIPEGLIPERLRSKMAAGKRWEHRCLRCQAVRMARVKVTRWRCRRCVEAGGSGRLGIWWVENERDTN